MKIDGKKSSQKVGANNDFFGCPWTSMAVAEFLFKIEWGVFN